MITDDDLLLHYYRDGLDATERARIGAALSEQPELAQRMQGLVARLDAAAALPEVPVPAEVQKRWKDALERAAVADVTRHVPRAARRFDLRWTAAAAIAALAFVFNQVATRPTPERAALVASPAAASAYERGLNLHLASTERQLAGFEDATPEERAILIKTIVAQNQMYAIAAERAGEPRLARVLRAFAPILESLEDNGGDASAALAQLSFELRVMQGRLGAGAAPSNAQSTTL